jgi:signal transduction histidine kinase
MISTRLALAAREHWLLASLLILALAGNVARFELFFGLDFIFGSIAVLVATYVYGTAWGVAAAALGGLYTWWLWGHPYGVVLFGLEALFVGLSLRYTRNILLLVGLYWLVLGMPLVWLFYGNILQQSPLQTALIALKDAVNGLFNALVASLIITHTPLRLPRDHTQRLRQALETRRLWRSDRLLTDHRTPLVPLSQVMFNLCVGSVLLPTLLLQFQSGRQILQRIERDLASDVETQAITTAGILSNWRERKLAPLQKIAAMSVAQGAVAKTAAASPGFAADVQLLSSTLNDLVTLRVTRPDGEVVVEQNGDAVLPEALRERAERLLSAVADSSKFQNANGTAIRVSLPPQNSSPMQGVADNASNAAQDTGEPLVAFAIPIALDDKILGSVACVMRLYSLQSQLADSLNADTMSECLLSHTRQIVLDAREVSAPASAIAKVFPSPENGEVVFLAPAIYRWRPYLENKPAVERWRRSSVVYEAPVEGLPFTLLVQAGLQPEQEYLNRTYFNNLLFTLGVLLVALLVAAVLSRLLTQPLVRLAHETTNLPERLLRYHNGKTPLKWPRSPMLELDALGRNFRAMARAIRNNFRDLQTAREQLEIERQRLDEANRLKDEFLAILSHELRTPLVPVIGYADLLARGALNAEEVGDAARSIERNARIQLRLIEDLLDVSRIISGKLRLEFDRVHLADAIHEAVDTVRLTAEAKSIALQTDIQAHPTVVGDPARIRQVLWNLLTNAIKFTPSGGTVSVSLRAEDDRIFIEVADTGQGIAPEFLPYVFDRFRQAADHLTRTTGGLGLGLAIVRHIVEAHDGKISAYSAGIGHGATFCVQLPMQFQPPAE